YGDALIVGAAIGRPPAERWDFISRCHLKNGDVSNIAAVYNRADAKSITANAAGRAGAMTMRAIFNANCPYGNTGRAMLAPTGAVWLRPPCHSENRNAAIISAQKEGMAQNR
ncbi:MAG: hypothetical protein ACI3VE_03610, partial [Oscillospiraceae bacterium]